MSRKPKPTGPDRLFIGVYPEWIVYADRATEVHGDYRRLAFLPYRELALDVKPDCPAELRAMIEAHAATVIARRGERFDTSTCGQYVTLGE